MPSVNDELPPIRERINQPAHVDSQGHLFIGDDEFPYVISDRGIKVEQVGKGRNHLMTLTIIVGGVTMDQRQPRREAQD